MTNPICPKCSEKYVKRVRREGITERLLSILYVYPFRCQLCGYRFRSFRWGVRYFRVDEYQREYGQIPAHFPVTFETDGVTGNGLVSEISMDGCSLQSERHLGQGQIVSMLLQTPNETYPIKVNAAIVRNVGLNRIGLEFLRFEAIERARMKLFISGALLARKTTARGWPSIRRARLRSSMPIRRLNYKNRSSNASRQFKPVKS